MMRNPIGKATKVKWTKLALVFCVTALSGVTFAQLGGAGSITGTVTDPSGAVVQNADVTAVNTATSTKTVRSTTSSGYYVLSPLDPGTYSVTVTARGFKTLTQDQIVVDALQAVGLNLTLPIGSVNESVEVSTAPPTLDTANATIGGTIENEVYTALPLQMNGAPRNATAFAYLEPGVSQSASNGSAGIYNGTGSFGNINELFLEGLPATRVAQQGDPR